MKISNEQLSRTFQDFIESMLRDITTNCGIPLELIERKETKMNAVRSPILRSSGKIELLPVGLDKTTGIITSTHSPYIHMNSLPEAVAGFHAIHKGAPWAGPSCFAVHIAAMLSVFGRFLLPPGTPRPAFAYTSDEPGMGTSLLTELAVLPSTGKYETFSAPTSPSEYRRVFDNAVLSDASYLVIDDFEGVVKSQDLLTFIATPRWAGRMFRSRRSFDLSKDIVCFIVGQNLRFGPDLRRRVLRCDLAKKGFSAKKLRDIYGRKFWQELICDHTKHGIHSVILTNLWALVKAWDEAGRPKPMRRLSGFEKWSDVFAGIVEYAGFGSLFPMEKGGRDE